MHWTQLVGIRLAVSRMSRGWGPPPYRCCALACPSPRVSLGTSNNNGSLRNSNSSFFPGKAQPDHRKDK
eukprot:1148351-Pelagomonas_calceolata.AAC.4